MAVTSYDTCHSQIIRPSSAFTLNAGGAISSELIVQLGAENINV